MLQSFLNFYTFLNNYLSVGPIFFIFFIFLIRHQKHNIQERLQSLTKQIQKEQECYRCATDCYKVALF